MMNFFTKVGAERLFDKGKKLYDNQSYDRALKVFKSCCKKYDYPPSQLYLGMSYVAVSSSSENDYGETALKWFEESLDNRESDLENRHMVCEQVALLYRSDTLNIGKDYSKAIKWFDKRIKSPYDAYDVPIFQHLADFYYSGGPHLNKDYASAVYCYKRTTHRNVNQNEKNHFNIANMYYEGGFGIQKSYVEALFWCHKILLHKNDDLCLWMDACLLLAKMFREGGYGIDKNNGIALRLYKDAKGVEKDSNYGSTFQIAIAEVYEEGGFGVERNYIRAYNIYMEQASLKHSYSMYKIGRFQELGLSMDKSYDEAFKYYLKASENGSSYGSIAIGNLYHHSRLSQQQNYVQALIWYEKSIEQDDKFAEPYNNIGYIYEQGCSEIKQDYTKALSYYKKAESLGDSEGQYNVGRCYFEGLGVPVNKDYAMIYFEKSFNNGNKEAQQYIEKCKNNKESRPLARNLFSLEELNAKLIEIEQSGKLLRAEIEKRRKQFCNSNF